MNDKTDIIQIEPDMRLGIIPARTPHDVIVQATIIAKELAKIVKDNRLSRNIQGREYVYVEGWSTMGAMLGVLPREVSELTRRYDDGSYEATVELIRITDGAVIGRASAFVGMDEKDKSGRLTWGSRPEYARRSMAITRATGKAYRLGFSWIMGLAGYAPTPAEEMDGVIDGEFTEASEGKKPTQQQPQQRKSGNGKVNPNLQALIDAGVSPNIPDAAGVLNLMKATPDELKDVESIVAWGKKYRSYRDQDETPEKATELANHATGRGE